MMLPLVPLDPSALVAGFEQTWRAGGAAFRSPHAPFSTAFGSCLCSRGRRLRRMFSWFSAPGPWAVPGAPGAQHGDAVPAASLPLHSVVAPSIFI